MGNASAEVILGFRILVSTAGTKQIISDIWYLYLNGIWAREEVIIRCFSEPLVCSLVLTMKQHRSDGSGNRSQSGPIFLLPQLLLQTCPFVICPSVSKASEFQNCQNLVVPWAAVSKSGLAL